MWPPLLARLTTDRQPIVRKAAGHNGATPAEPLARMKNTNEVDFQRRRLLFLEVYTLPLGHDIANEVAKSDRYQDEHRFALARRPRIPSSVRGALASFWKLTPDVAEVLVSDDNPLVRAAVAGNRGIPAAQMPRRVWRDRARGTRGLPISPPHRHVADGALVPGPIEPGGGAHLTSNKGACRQLDQW